MKTYTEEARLKTLESKGGVMYFLVEKPDRIYRGMVLLSPAHNHNRKRIVCMKVYKINEEGRAK